MKKRYISLGIILLAVLLVISGCGVSQEKYDTVESDLIFAQAEVASLQNDLDDKKDQIESIQNDLDAALAEAASLQSALDAAQVDDAGIQKDLDAALAEIESLQSDLDAATDEKDTLTAELIATNNEKDDLQDELDEMKSVYPPSAFSSVDELSDWASAHKQTSTIDVGQLFEAALEVQQQGLQDGYLISVVYEQDERYPNNAWVYNGAMVNGSYYVWNPITGTFYYWVSNIA